MASSIYLYAVIFILIFCRSINGENKESTQKEKRQTFPNFNEISLSPSGGTNLLYDLLGLRSIPSLDYSIPTLQLPLKLTQKPPEASENKPNFKSTPRPAPPLPPPPPAVLPKQQSNPNNHYTQPAAVSYKPPFETLHYPQYQVAERPKVVPIAAVGYKKQDTPLNSRHPVPQFIIISRRPLPSVDNLRQLPVPQQPQAHPLRPPQQNAPIVYAGPPRVAIHENYNIQELPVNQGAPAIIKPQDSQVVQNEQVIRGPRYYLPQPTKGHEGYFGPFEFAPGSFDALLKSDVSFLDHLSGNVNKSDNPQSSIKDESYNTHGIPNPPPPPPPPSEHQPSVNEKYYKPQQSNSYSSEGSQNPHINSGHSSQNVEEKEQAYHNPIPIQDSKVNEDKDKTLNPNVFDHRYLAQQPPQIQYTDRNPIGPIYRIIPQSNPPNVAYQTQPVNNYRTPVQYASAVQPNAQILPVAYRPEIQPNYVAQLPYRQEIQPVPYVNYRPQEQPQIHRVNPVSNIRQSYPNPSQALVNQEYAAIPNHAINQPKIAVVGSYPNGYTRGRSATGHIVENLENHKTEEEVQRPEITGQHLKYERDNYHNLPKYDAEKSRKFDDETRSEKSRDYNEDHESEQQSSNDYDKDDDKPDQYRSYKNKEEYRPQEESHNNENHRYNSNTRSRDFDDDDEPFDEESSSHRRSKRQVTKQYKTSSNDPSVLKVFREIAINDTDGVLVDERYVRNKEGKPVHVYTQTQPITYSESSTEAARNYELPVPDETSKEAYATPGNVVTATPETDTIVQEVRVDSSDDDKPDCAKNKNIPICTSDDHYPKEKILKALSQENNFLSKLSGVTALFNSSNAATNGRVPPIAENNWDNICPSVVSHITPFRARNLKGEWKIIVNVEEVKQNLNIETCLKVGERCNLVPLQFKTQCDQKYAILHLLTFDDNEGLMVDQFLVPAACSCSVAKSIK